MIEMKIILTIIYALTLFPQQKKLVFENRTYEAEIKTVQLYSQKQEFRSNLLPAVTSINQNDLMLEFDDLRNDINNYYARVIHCKYNWEPSSLRDLDYMTEYNEFNVNDYAYSSNTYIPYVHYQFNLPRVKLPGNYLLVVYRDGNKNDIILSHRFMVYDQRTTINQDNQTSGALALRSTNQQLNFIIGYQGLNIVNPLETVHIVVRQNQRWDNAKTDVKPSFVREDRSQIEYRLFGDDKFFEAGNEFRFVDFRSVNFPGQQTDRIDKNVKPFHLWVQPDFPRNTQVYSQYPDLNGQFAIENLDNGDSRTASQYINVTFTLKSEERSASKIFVLGAFNQWIRNDESRMLFDASKGVYSNSVLLKQGWYNYQYLLEDKNLPPLYLEGSHFETENFYEVFFYYTPFQPNADLLVGYFVIPVNKR